MRVSTEEPDIGRLLKADEAMRHNRAFALSEFRALAEIGSPLAAIHLGRACELGDGIDKSENDAEQWYRRATELDLIAGYFFLGRLFLKQRRYDEALAVLRLGAAHEYAPALHYLGRMFFFGMGVNQDFKKSKNYLERAVAGKNILAKLLLARLLMENPENPFDRIRGTFLRIESAGELLWVLITKGQRSERLH